jgi:hypothetical protein
MSEQENDFYKGLLSLVILFVLVFMIVPPSSSSREYFLNAIILLASFFVSFKIFLPYLEGQFTKAVILTIITVLANALFGWMSFSGRLFAVVVGFISLKMITKINFGAAIILMIIVTIINIGLLWLAAYL